MKSRILFVIAMVLLVFSLGIHAETEEPFPEMLAEPMSQEKLRELDEICSEMQQQLRLLEEQHGSTLEDSERFLLSALHDRLSFMHETNDWQSLQNDLYNCTDTDHLRSLLKKGYRGITESQAGQLTAADALKAGNQILSDAGFSSLKYTACINYPYYGKWTVMWMVSSGDLLNSVHLQLTPALKPIEIASFYGTPITSVKSTEDQRVYLECRAATFLAKYHHENQLLLDTTYVDEYLGKADGNEEVGIVRIFTGAFLTDGISDRISQDMQNNNWSQFIIGVESGIIYEYHAYSFFDHLQ